MQQWHGEKGTSSEEVRPGDIVDREKVRPLPTEGRGLMQQKHGEKGNSSEKVRPADIVDREKG
jgi:hypothetical protein